MSKKSSDDMPNLLDKLTDWSEYLPSPTYWKNRAGEYLGCNEAFLAAIQMKREAVIGKKDGNLWEKKTADRIKRNDLKVLNQGKSVSLIEKIEYPNGHIKYFKVNKRPLKAQDKTIIGVISQASEITKQKQIENTVQENYQNMSARLNDIVDCTPGNIYWKDKTGRYLGANTFFIKNAGLTCRDEVIGKTDAELFGLKKADQLRKNDHEVMQNDKAMTTEEKTTMLDGSARVFIAAKMPLKDREQNIIGIIGNSLDITDQKNAQQALFKAKKKAEISDHAKTRFIEDMSHDLRTPAAGILGMAEMLAEGLKDPTLKQYSDYMILSCKNLLEMLNQILENTQKINQNRSEQGCTNLKELAHYLVDLLKPCAIQKGLKLSCSYDDKALPEYFLTDTYKIKHSLMNLLANAIKFTDEGSVSLDIVLDKTPIEPTDNTDNYLVKIMVKDTGIGINPKDQHKIFDRFTRLNPAYQNKYKGIGLGLSITHQFIKALGGDIQVTSQLGQGTCFTCLIPLRKYLSQSKHDTTYRYVHDDDQKEALLLSSLKTNHAMNNTNQTAELHQQDTASQNNIDDKIRLLLVEDDIVCQKMGKDKLQKLNCWVDTAYNSAETLEKYKKNQYDCVIMDIGLPDQDGLLTTRALRTLEKRKKQKPVPVIALTAHLQEDMKTDCVEAGLNEVLTKPICLKAISNLFERYQIGSKTTQPKPLKKNLKQPEKETLPVIEWPKAHNPEEQKDIQALLVMLLETFDATRESLKAAYTKKDWAELRNVVHKFHGGACYCPTPQLKKAAFDLESALMKSDISYAEIGRLYESLLKDMAELEQTEIQSRTS